MGPFWFLIYQPLGLGVPSPVTGAGPQALGYAVSGSQRHGTATAGVQAQGTAVPGACRQGAG